jgi:predicted permease
MRVRSAHIFKVFACICSYSSLYGNAFREGENGNGDAYMPQPLFRLWAIVVIVFATPIVVAAGLFFATEYSPFLRYVLSLIAWAYITVMAYIAIRAGGRTFGPQ